jgi:hypothetical protein
MELLVKPEILTSYIYKLSCSTVLCKHFAIHQCYPNYRWDLIRYSKGFQKLCNCCGHKETVNGREMSLLARSFSDPRCAHISSTREQCKLGSGALLLSPTQTPFLFSTSCLHSTKISSLFALNVHS